MVLNMCSFLIQSNLVFHDVIVSIYKREFWSFSHIVVQIHLNELSSLMLVVIRSVHPEIFCGLDWSILYESCWTNRWTVERDGLVGLHWDF